ncbi:unnamed protein product [Prorocentrum cordatum]|uniref:Uncharacterized protein n=1 Tax=Prorocentrum cordatum TaxID=2364126 RepID=A0ABN9S1I8_9DINO|nr:unnamed protein product [Polarella glacialis]
MQSSVFTSSHIIGCGDSYCTGSSSNTISGNTFKLCSSYECADTSSPGASAVGDPHLQNIYGERFDLMKPGVHVLINIPRGVSADAALLRAQADARRLGGQCADLYFQELNVTGSWAEAQQVGSHHYSVSTWPRQVPPPC